VSLTVSLTVSPTVSLTVSPTVPPSLSPSLCLPLGLPHRRPLTAGSQVYPHGSTDALPYVTMGSGSLAAMAVFEQGYKEGLTLEDAKLLVARSIRAGIFNDLGSGSNVDLCVINKEGKTYLRNYECPNERTYASTKGFHFAPGTTRACPPLPPPLFRAVPPSRLAESVPQLTRVPSSRGACSLHPAASPHATHTRTVSASHTNAFSAPQQTEWVHVSRRVVYAPCSLHVSLQPEGLRPPHARGGGGD
jgi:hypothetical protein